MKKAIPPAALSRNPTFPAGGNTAVSVSGLEGDPLVSFGAAEIRQALDRIGCRASAAADADLKIVFDLHKSGLGPQGFRIRKEGVRVVRVIGGDNLGAMYGGLELAETIERGGLGAIADKARKPYIFKRGIKLNIPLDARTPSYDDTGTAAEENIPVMWEWDFWESYLNDLARNRYNVLTLWVTHPYPGWVELPEYPDIGYDDVMVNAERRVPGDNRHFDGLDQRGPEAFRTVKSITIKEKVAFWRRVFQLAKDRGLDLYVFHWNIYAFGANGRHGIDDLPDNPKTVEYFRYAIGRFLKTYPQIDGIGLTAGEHVDPEGIKRYGGIQKWLWDTYGQAVMDVKRADPGRELTIVFRQHMSRISDMKEAFAGFDGPFHTDHKYARARLYMTTTPPYLDIEYRDQLEEQDNPCWLNLRNDDVYVLRWGDAEYVREFLQNTPRDLMRHEAGFYMGPDGYVFGRDFVSLDPSLAGGLEVSKHWYRFMLWGRLGYDIALPEDYFEDRIARRLGSSRTAALIEAWTAASRIIPAMNHFFFRKADYMFSPEACVYSLGFVSLDQFFEFPPMDGSGMLDVNAHAAAVLSGSKPKGITPLEVADKLDGLADKALNSVSQVRSADQSPGKELGATIEDIEAFAHLGRYYADKIRAAAHLAVYRADPTKSDYHQLAIGRAVDAIADWEAYALNLSARCHPQLLARTHYFDPMRTLEDVKAEADRIRAHPLETSYKFGKRELKH